MHFTTFLKRHFDIDIHHNYDPSIQGTNNTGKDVTEIWIFEKGEESEPLLILKESWWYTETKSRDCWLVGNIYSTLEHGLEVSESQFRALVKKGQVRSSFSDN